MLLDKSITDEFYSKFYHNIGVVTGIIDGIVTMRGLLNVSFGERIEFIVESQQEPIVGMVLNIEKQVVYAVVLEEDSAIKPGQKVLRTTSLISVPTGEALLGRILNPLGKPIDGLGPINCQSTRFIEKIAPSIISRSPVNLPLETGLKVIDSMVPIGHGQRELIIGDTKTGKTSIAIDTILNQRDHDTLSIYVVIGQKRSSVARISKVLADNDCLKSTIIVAATASDSAALQYIAPYAGCAIAEYFMNLGMRCLIIYDDLTKHATSYRQLSLLLRRPPGREGFPGDVFYTHSRLLERAANLKNNGSITALPIIETIQSDVSAYIPTNVISITDGQIFMDTELFSRGIRPAVSPGLSVSRVGSAAQSKVLKKMAGTLKLELAQFREVEGFIKLGFELDDATKQLVDRGMRLTRLLIQKRYKPLSIDKQILFLYAALKGYLD
jgi:F-type H+-transporting ATPase subunit alpha